MSKFKTIMTIEAIKEFTGIGKDFPVLSLIDIRKIEEKEFLDCLGIPFYNDLIAALASYTYASYSDVTAYVVGNVVEYQGVLYINIVNSTGVIPTNTVNWKPATLFDSGNSCGSEYENFYCNYLGAYLSNCILLRRLPFIHNKIKGEGVISKFGNDYQAVSNRSYEEIKGAIRNEIKADLQLLRLHIARKKDEGLTCYDNFEEEENISTSTCTDCNEELK